MVIIVIAFLIAPQLHRPTLPCLGDIMETIKNYVDNLHVKLDKHFQASQVISITPWGDGVLLGSDSDRAT